MCGCGGGGGRVRRQCSHTKMRINNGRNGLLFQLNFKEDSRKSVGTSQGNLDKK